MNPDIRVRVLLFGAFREALGAAECERSLAAGSSLGELWEELARDCPALAEADPSRLAAVNLDYAGEERVLADGDEIAFFPPVSGG